LVPREEVVSWLFIAKHSEVETAGMRGREMKTAKKQVRDKIARPVNRSENA
jgi:hypothetical protein